MAGAYAAMFTPINKDKKVNEGVTGLDVNLAIDLVTLITVVYCTIGGVFWTFCQSHADRIPTLAKNDQIFPWFIAHELSVGFVGLVLAAVAAATMSTLSANLNSAASAVTTDFYKSDTPFVCSANVRTAF